MLFNCELCKQKHKTVHLYFMGETIVLHLCEICKNMLNNSEKIKQVKDRVKKLELHLFKTNKNFI